MRFCHNFYSYLFAASDTSGAMQLNLHYHQSLSLPQHSDSPQEYNNSRHRHMHKCIHIDTIYIVYTETHATNTQAHNSIIHQNCPTVHTSSSSFTLHLPPSRRDWTSCNLPSSEARSRSLSSEVMAAACVTIQQRSQHRRGWQSAYNIKLFQR